MGETRKRYHLIDRWFWMDRRTWLPPMIIPNIVWIKQTFNDTWREMNPISNEGSMPSYPIAEDGYRIDYIFASNFSSIIDSRIVSDMIPGINVPWEFGSDHLPVVTTLKY